MLLKGILGAGEIFLSQILAKTWRNDPSSISSKKISTLRTFEKNFISPWPSGAPQKYLWYILLTCYKKGPCVKSNGSSMVFSI